MLPSAGLTIIRSPARGLLLGCLRFRCGLDTKVGMEEGVVELTSGLTADSDRVLCGQAGSQVPAISPDGRHGAQARSRRAGPVPSVPGGRDVLPYRCASGIAEPGLVDLPSPREPAE